MKSQVHRPRLSLLVCFSMLLAGPVFAQSDRGTITGTVSDPGGGVVPNASVTIRGVDTGAEYKTITTATGNYTVPQLPSGRYNPTVASPGFSQMCRRASRSRSRRPRVSTSS